MSKRVLNTIRLLLTLALLIWVFIYICNHYPRYLPLLQKADTTFLLLSSVAYGCHLLLVYSAWRKILNADHIVRPDALLGNYLFSNLAKYIPGGLGQIGGRLAGLREQGIPVSHVSIALIIEQFYALAICSLAISLLIPFTHLGAELHFLEHFRWVIFLVGVISLALLLTNIPVVLLARIIPKLDDIKSFAHKPAGVTTIILFAYAAFILAYYCSYLAYPEMPVITVSDFSFYLLLATLLGFLAVFVPAGLGVREGVLIVFLSQYVSYDKALLVAVFPRFILILVETGFFLLWLSFRFRFSIGKNP